MTSTIKNTVGVNASGTQRQEFAYGYDPNSNRLSETRKTDGATSKQLAFNYDELNRLALTTDTVPAPTTQPAPGQSIQVTENSLLTGNGYDAVGNRDGITTQTKVRTITRTANGQGQVTETSSEQAGQVATATAQFDALNRLTNLSENNINTAFAYDNNGNLLSETVAGTVQKRYEYDTRDQLKKVFAGANTQLAQFDYDFNRHRTSKQTANTNLHYVYAGDEVVDEFDSSSGLLPLANRYELGAGEVVKGELRNEPTNYYFSDALGSTTNLSQINGTQSFSTSTSEYDSFGKVNNQTGASANTIGYTGQRLDTETGLMALGNGERYYSPQLARFTQQDSFTGMTTMPQSLNRYAYSYNNPFSFRDPSGNLPEYLTQEDPLSKESNFIGADLTNRRAAVNNSSDSDLWKGVQNAGLSFASTAFGIRNFAIRTIGSIPRMAAEPFAKVADSYNDISYEWNQTKYEDRYYYSSSNRSTQAKIVGGGYSVAGAKLDTAKNEALAFGTGGLEPLFEKVIGNGMDYAEGRITLDQYNMGQGEALGEAGSMYAMARVARGGGKAEPITLQQVKTTIGNAAQRLKSVAGDFAEGYRANSRGINFTSGGMQNALEGIEGGIKNVLENRNKVVSPLDRIMYRMEDAPSPPMEGGRQVAIDRAWRQEIDLIEKSGRGSRPWTNAEIERIKAGEGYRDLGYTGHHLNPVNQFKKWQGDPRNIEFLRQGKGEEHMTIGHPGGTRAIQPARPLIDRESMLNSLDFLKRK